MWSYKLSLLSLLLFLGSCSLNPCGNSKAKFLERMNELSELAAKSDWAYSDARWDKHDEQFKLLVEQCYEQFDSELTGKEKRRFWTQSLRYQYKRVGSGMSKELLDPKDGKLKQWRNELDNLPKEEMRELLDDIEKDLNNWSEQLREIFK